MIFRCRVGCRLAVAAWLIVGATTQAQFVAFNDHAPTSGWPTNSSGTHSNATTWDCLIEPTSGLLKNITNGLDTPVLLTISHVMGNPNVFAGGSAANYPQIGTPANLTFTNFVDFVGTPNASVHISNAVLHYTFSGLDPSKRYHFAGSHVRGGSGSNYTNRWTKVTIVGAEAYTSAHTSNVVTSARQSTFADNEAAVTFGVNLSGDMVAWNDINPGDDGIFDITCEQYRGPLPPPYNSTNNNPPYGYGITAIRLEEVSPEPVVITDGPSPSSLTIEQRQTAQFTVTVTGTAPRYEWFREDGQPITNAVSTNSNVLTITNAQPSDSGVYRVHIANTVSSTNSDSVTLTVNPDMTPPTLLSALGLADGTNIVLGFSEPLDSATPLSNGAFHFHLSADSNDLVIVSVFVTNETNVVITTDAARGSNLNYTVTIDASAVSDVDGVAFAGGEIDLATEIYLLRLDGTEWKYNADGINLGLDFYLPAPQFDDSAWLSGFPVFDAKSPQPPGRTNVAGFTVATQLPLTNDLYSTSTNVIPTYYFRTHFNVPVPPEHVIALKLQTLVDDFDDFFINGQEAHRNSGYPATNPPPRFGYAGGTAVSTASVLGPFDIVTNLLVAGDNLGAVILNQVSASSSDITFAYELVAIIDRFPVVIPPQVLTIGWDPDIPGHILITWPASDAGLYGATEPDSNNWLPIDTTATPGRYSFDPTAGSSQFFTLRK